MLVSAVVLFDPVRWNVFASVPHSILTSAVSGVSSHKSAESSHANVERAAAALKAGQIALLPTETVYGLFVSASRAQDLITLRKTHDKQFDPNSPVATTWHAPSVDAVTSVLEIRTPVHLHLLRALARSGGPVRFLIESSESTGKQLIAKHASLPVFKDDTKTGGGFTFSVRIPEHKVCAAVLEQVNDFIVADRASGLGLCDPAFTDGVALKPDAEVLAKSLGIPAIIDAGSTHYKTGSTTIRLTREGWWKFESAGALSESQVRAKVETSVLFVCTGNTCRSPMGEAVAKHLLAKPGVTLKPTRIASAGVSAFGDDPMTPEAREALRGFGINAGPHRSQALTKSLVENADVIYAMTNAHAKRVVELIPDAKDKVQLLDPTGRDIADPIGGTLADYRASAETIAKLVEQRLAELHLILPPNRKGILETW